MHSFIDSKLMAKALRQALAERGVTVSHSDALELVARQFGFANWNMLAARIEAAQVPPLPLPAGWRVAGHTDTRNYRLGLDPGQPGTALIESYPGRAEYIDRSAGETAVLMQSVLADSYAGQRVRLTAELRTEAAETATIWLRVDSAGGGVMHFDNLLEREGDGALHGDSGWVTRHVVLEVPDNAATLHFGFLLLGSGKVWARGFSLEPVGTDIASTEPGPRYHPAPVNLDFGAGSGRRPQA